MTSAGLGPSPSQAPGPSGSGRSARLALISCAVRASWPGVRLRSDTATFWLPPGERLASASVKLVQFALTWTVLTVGASLAVVWCSAWDRACRLSAGPAIAANTQSATSRASASVLATAAPTARFRPDTGPRPDFTLILLPRHVARRRRRVAGRW